MASSMTRSDVSSDEVYANYVRYNIKTDMLVVCVRRFKIIEEADYGKIIEINEEDLRGLTVLVDWIGVKVPFWVKYVNVAPLGFFPSEKIGVGDWVRVKRNVVEPTYKWGNVNRQSIGIVTAKADDGSLITVNFQEDSTWKGRRDEMESIPSLHPCVTCDGCKSAPLKGSRFTCSECDNFDFCQACFEHNTDHRHKFRRIICHGGKPVNTGLPGPVISVGDYVRVKSTVKSPKYGWGHIEMKGRRSIGQVTVICADGEDFQASFRKQKVWQGLLSEIEVVDVVHVTVKCDGCRLCPVGGDRYKCKECDDFDYCEDCFNTKTNHKHDFVKITKPERNPQAAGKPPKATSVEIESAPESESEDSNVAQLFADYGMAKDLLWWMLLTKALQSDDSDEEPKEKETPVLKATRSDKAAVNVGGDELCPYQSLCRRYKESLSLNAKLFEVSFDQCFCRRCIDKRGDGLCYKRGDPPKDYKIPVGWCKFGLSTPARAQSVDAFRAWHMAFHGTKPDCVRRILDTGDLLMPGDVTMEGSELRPPSNHWDPENSSMKPPEGHDIRKIYLSPSIQYSGCNVYAPATRFEDKHSSKKYDIRVALQVRIKPDSYDVGEQTIGAESQIDTMFPNSEIEWSTKARGVVILTGLLVKVDNFPGELGTPSGSAQLSQGPLERTGLRTSIRRKKSGCLLS